MAAFPYLKIDHEPNINIFESRPFNKSPVLEPKKDFYALFEWADYIASVSVSFFGIKTFV